MRPDHGQDPAALGRSDIEAFLNRLAYLAAIGQISTDARIRAVREVRGVLTAARAMGMTHRGAVAAGLGPDFTIDASDVPDEPEPGESGRDLAAEVMQQICARLEDLTSATMRTAIELAIDTGRRPEEICDLTFGCLAHDDDELPVLVFDNHKANRLGRRLPISEATAQVITTAQQRVRAAYPTPPSASSSSFPPIGATPTGGAPSPRSASRSTHLDDLLRNRERLLATQNLEDWARAEALPSQTEITRIRRLISQVEAAWTSSNRPRCGVSEANLKDLEDAGLKFIVGARIPDIPYQVKKWRAAPRGGDPGRTDLHSAHVMGPKADQRSRTTIYQYRADRARRTLCGIDEQIAKAKKAIKGQTAIKRNRYALLTGATKTINRDLEAKTRGLAGLIGLHHQPRRTHPRVRAGRLPPAVAR